MQSKGARITGFTVSTVSASPQYRHLHSIGISTVSASVVVVIEMERMLSMTWSVESTELASLQKQCTTTDAFTGDLMDGVLEPGVAGVPISPVSSECLTLLL